MKHHPHIPHHKGHDEAGKPHGNAPETPLEEKAALDGESEKEYVEAHGYHGREFDPTDSGREVKNPGAVDEAVSRVPRNSDLEDEIDSEIEAEFAGILTIPPMRDSADALADLYVERDAELAREEILNEEGRHEGDDAVAASELEEAVERLAEEGDLPEAEYPDI